MGAAPVPYPWNYLFQILACLSAPVRSSEGWTSHKWIWSCKYIAPEVMENDQMKSLKTEGPEGCVVIVEEHKSPSSVSKTLTSCLHFNIGLSFTRLVKWNLWEVQSKEHVQVCSRGFRVGKADVGRRSLKIMKICFWTQFLWFVMFWVDFFTLFLFFKDKDICVICGMQNNL